MKPVKIYTKEMCPYCVSAKDFFKTLKVEYEEIDVEDPANREEHMSLVEKYNHRTVPMIFIGEEFIGGFDNLMELQKEGKVKAMLEK